ncbi:MAG: hypothetical protein LBD75_07045 [Candidatus Peribacteria bacterium]|jgi:hypothetical protein|nr:hypothetical protein [Candidatus Peribacteria bacterium]
MHSITTLIQTQQTVFRYEQLITLFSQHTKKALTQFLYRAKQTGKLLNPQRGIWTLPVYDHFELASAFFPDGYISLESVLNTEGISFQWYGNTTTVISSKSADIFYNGHHYIARKMKNTLLQNPLFVRTYERYRKATVERAFCDMVYLRPKAHFDNPQYFQNQ